MAMTNHIESSELMLFADGEVTPSRSTEIQSHLGSCTECRTVFNAHQHIIESLGDHDPALDDIDLVPGIWKAIEEEKPAQEEPTEAEVIRPDPSIWGRRFAMTAGALAAMWLAITIVPTTEAPLDNPAFQTRSGDTADTAATALVGISAYQLGTDGKPAYLGKSMSAAGGLLFSYANRTETPYSNLMIFAVDAKGESHWYYPAYLDEKTNPTSINITPSQTGVELREVIVHDLAKGPLTLYGLFSNKPIDVKTIEALVKSNVEGPTWKPGTTLALPLDDISLQVVTTTVD